MQDGPPSAKLRDWKTKERLVQGVFPGPGREVVDNGVQSFIIYILHFLKGKQNPVIFQIKY